MSIKSILGISPRPEANVYTASNTTGVLRPDVQKLYAEAAEKIMNQAQIVRDTPYQMGSDLNRMRMLMMRLRINESYSLPLDHISTGLGGDHVFVFVVKDGKPVTLTDDAAMFPSDALVTQLRLLLP